MEEYGIYVRDIVDCLKEHLQDNALLGQLNLWPTKRFLCLSNILQETQILDDVQSASDSWAKQDILGENGITVPLILYADATLISRFNGRKFHPVILRNGLVPSHFRSGTEFGGGILIGYIAQVSHFKSLVMLLLIISAASRTKR